MLKFDKLEMNNTDVKQLSFHFITYLVRLPPPAVNQSLHVQIMAIFLGGLDGKEFACSAGDLVSIPGSEIFYGEGNSNPLQYSCLVNSMGRGV